MLFQGERKGTLEEEKAKSVRAALQESMAESYREEHLVVAMLEKEMAG